MKRAWRDWVRSILLTVLVITAFRSAVADWNDVPTGSMKPTILEGDRIVVNKLAYDLRLPYAGWRMASWADPERGDIVVLRSPDDKTRLVKRVVGIPGDTIWMIDNRLVVNDEEIHYGPLDPTAVAGLDAELSGQFLATEQLGPAVHSVMITPGSHARSSFSPTRVPPQSFFVMGRATVVAASVDPAHSYLPRWKRFFHGLD